jgi:hypothetical protein
MENDVVRHRRASDVANIAAAPDVAVGPLDFGGKAAWLAVGAGRELSVRAVPSLEEITRVPVERRSLDLFSIDAITADPAGSLVVTCDDGGRDEDDRGNTTGRDPAQVTLFDATTGARLAVADHGERARDVLFDRWRRRLYVLTDAGISVRSPAGELLSTFRVYEDRSGVRARHITVCATFLATIADERGRVARTIDFWDPLTFRALGSFDLPDDGAPTWMVASPDGSILVTGGEDGVRLSGVAFDRVPSPSAGTPAEDPAVELVRLAGPIVHASTLAAGEIERAVAEGRAMVIQIDSCMGSRDIVVSANLGRSTAPDLVLARRVPSHLREVGDASWDVSDDVYRDLRVERPRVRAKAKTRRPRKART